MTLKLHHLQSFGDLSIFLFRMKDGRSGNSVPSSPATMMPTAMAQEIC
jgi:hypothetical protein